MSAQWYAIKTRQDFKAEQALAPLCEEVYFPKETVRLPDGRTRQKAAIPHVLFIKTTPENALALEQQGRITPETSILFWIYRYPKDRQLQTITQQSIDLLRLLTADDTTPCRIYTPAQFTVGERVRVTGGLYKGYEGFVKRIGRDRHVIVEIQGICMVILPYIHPDLLQKF